MPSSQRCHAFGCGERKTPDNPIKLHSFPRNEYLCAEWVKRANNPALMGKPMKKVSNYAYLCERHFTADQYQYPQKKKLHVDAIPSVFPGSETSPTLPAIEASSLSYPSSSSQTCPLPIEISLASASSSSALSPNPHNPVIICNTSSSLADPLPSDDEISPVVSQAKKPMTPTPSSFPPSPPSSSNIKSLTVIKNLSMRKVGTLTPRKKFLHQKYVRISKRLFDFKRKQQARIKKILKRDSSDTVCEMILGKAGLNSDIIMTSLLRNYSKKKNARRWTLKEKLIFLSLYKRSPRNYLYLSTLLNIPSAFTLKSVLRSIPFSSGVNPFIFKHLQHQVSLMSEKDKYCILLFDEMAIKPCLIYNPHIDTIEGFQDHGSGDRSNGIASEALVFMVRGLRSKWKMPMAYYFTCGSTPGPVLANLLKGILNATRDAGLRVVATVCDMGSNNCSALSSLGSTKQHPYIRFAGEKIFTIYDPPHLLKCTRNMFMKYGIKGEVTVGGVAIPRVGKWTHIEETVNLSRRLSGNIVPFPKISPCALNPKWREKMKVSLAAHVFSRSLASQMDIFVGLGLIDQGASVTAEFLQFIKQLFCSFNGSVQQKNTDDNLLGPLSEKSRHLAFWEEAVEKINTFKFLKLFPSGEPKVIRPKSQDGWITSIKGMKLLWNELGRAGYTSLEMRRINQDPIENLFGSVRFHCGSNSNPTIQQFTSALKASIVNGLCKNSPKGNCEADADEFVTDLEKILLSIPPNPETPLPSTTGIDNTKVGDVSITSTAGELSLFSVSNAIFKSILDQVSCLDCRKLLSSEQSLIGEHFNVFEDLCCPEGRPLYPSELMVQSVNEAVHHMNIVIPSVAAKVGVKKLLVESLGSVAFSWLHCKTVIEKVLGSVAVFVIRQYCAECK